MKHMSNAHDETRSKSVPCPQCDKMCYDQESLKKHMAVHSGEPRMRVRLCALRLRSVNGR